MLGWKELLIVLVIVLVIFGTKRLIGAGGDLGKAIQSFKKGMKDAQDDPAKLEPPAPPASDAERKAGAQPGADRDSQGR